MSDNQVYELLQPIIARAAATSFYEMLGGDKTWSEAPEPSPGDEALAADITLALIKELKLRVVHGHDGWVDPGAPIFWLRSGKDWDLEQLPKDTQ